ncbi:MAG: hypothetical protein J6K72_10195 [Clostridia bacterium]|nr:hypothetical protein [Clostridia bacterium]
MADELSITNESLAAMYQYCTAPSQAIEHMVKSVAELMDTYDRCKGNLVQAHTTSYVNVLEGFKTVLQSINNDLNGSSDYIKKKTLIFQQIIDGGGMGSKK